MKSSLLILIVFAIGLLVGYLQFFQDVSRLGEISTYILFGMMFLVGVSVGCDKNIKSQFKLKNLRILLIPVTVLVGTGLGMVFYHLLFKYPDATNLYAIGSGLGYYSLSSIVITKVSGETMGIVALLANIIREITTLVLAPILAKYFGKLAPIASAGATSSDTTLPIIMKYSGKEYVIISVFNGIILTLLVPVIIAMIYSI